MIRKKFILALALIILLTSTGIGLTFFFTLGNFDEVCEGQRNIANQNSDFTGIDLKIDVPLGNIEINDQIQKSNNLFEIIWKIEYKKYGLFSADQISIDITSNIENEKLKLSVKMTKDPRIKAKDITYSNITIYANPNLEKLNLIGDLEQANFLLELYGIDFEDLKLTATSGDIETNLNRSEVSGDFSIKNIEGEIDLCLDFIDVKRNMFVSTYSGIILLDLWDLTFSSNGNISCVSSEGKINFRWATHFRKFHSVQILLQTSYDIEMRFWSPYEFSKYKVIYHKTSGRTHFGGPAGQYTKINSLTFQSNNYAEDLDHISVLGNTSTGDIWMKFVDCFKPHRFCALRPTEVISSSTQGVIEIPRPGTSVSEVLIYNNIEGIMLDQDWLASNSENAVKIRWSLNFTKGSDFGYGDLKVAAIYETVETQLKITIELDYEIDRIRPIINDYDITLSKHPSYSFTLVG